MHLLARLAVAVAWSVRAEQGLELDGGVIDSKDGQRLSPWIVIQEKQVRAITALTTKLRLCPQSRTDSRAAGRTANACTGPVPWEESASRRLKP